MPLDLHVLGTPPAFVLSQDQTLRCKKLLSLGSSAFAESSPDIICLSRLNLKIKLTSRCAHTCQRTIPDSQLSIIENEKNRPRKKLEGVSLSNFFKNPYDKKSFKALKYIFPASKSQVFEVFICKKFSGFPVYLAVRISI